VTPTASILVTGGAGYIGSHAVRGGAPSTQYNLGNGKPPSVMNEIDCVEPPPHGYRKAKA
jgi:hypothetical protein